MRAIAISRLGWSRVCFVLLPLVLALGAGGYALAENVPAYHGLEAMPAGAITVDNLGNGDLCVKARCVSADAYAKELGKYLKKPVVFAAPIKSLLTVWLGDQKRTAAFWLSRGMENIGCLVKETASAYEVAPMGLGANGYDATLDIDAAPLPVAPAGLKSGTKGIETGLYFYQGFMIPPPYSVELGYSAKGVSILLNGVKIEELSGTPDVGEYHEPPANVRKDQVETDTENVTVLQQNCGWICLDAAAQGATYETARLWVLSYASQFGFLTIKDVGRPNILVDCRIKGQPPLLPTTLIEGELRSHNFKEDKRGLRGVSPIQQGLEAKKSLEAALAREEVTIHGVGQVAFNGRDSVGKLRDALAGKFGASRAVAECVVAELVEDRAMARAVVLNTEANKQRVVDALSAVLARVK